MGRIEIGSENSAGYKLMTGAPGVGGIGINSGSLSAFLSVELGASTVTSTNATTLAQTSTNNIELQETASTIAYEDGDDDGLVEELVSTYEFTGNLGSFVGQGNDSAGAPVTDNIVGESALGNDPVVTDTLATVNGEGDDVTVELATIFAQQNGLAVSSSVLTLSSGDESTVNLSFTDADGGGLVGPSRFRDAFGSSFTETSRNNDAQRISYYSPSFNGLTIGVSYAPNDSEGNGAVDRNAAASDFIDLGVNYSQSFGAMDLTMAARYGTADATGSTTVYDLDADGKFQTGDSTVGFQDGEVLTKAIANSDPETWAIVFQLGYDAFTFGASYAENDTGIAYNAGDSEGYSVGMTYDVAGPWTVGAEMYSGEANMGSLLRTNMAITATGDGDDEVKTSATLTTDTTTTREKVTAEHTSFKLGATRNLGAGVNWSIYAIQSEQKAKTATRTLAGETRESW